jgi:ParB family chromosome partitioning protein
MLLTSIIPVKKITCNQPLQFSDNELEKAAQSILDSKGIINPVVVRRTSLKSYELVDGVFEYYAAARAREINPFQGEMITAFIIEPENDEFLTKQVDLFRKLKSTCVETSSSSLSYKELQSKLKTLRANGLTSIKLNSKKSVLQAEYDRLTQSV